MICHAHAHHDTALTDMTHFQSLATGPNLQLCKPNRQLYKIMTDVLWVYPDNCSPEKYPRVGGILPLMGVIGVQL